MESILERYKPEIIDFVSVETLTEIDYGILDLSRIMDFELKDVLYYCAELLEVELRLNYKINDTGIFRVRRSGDVFLYEEFGEVLEADSICELEELVLRDCRIWYVFDEIQAKEMR